MLAAQKRAMRRNWRTALQRPPRKGRPAALAASTGGRREATQGESICPAKTQRCLAADLGQQLLFALALMVASALGPMRYFRKRGWLK